MREYIKKIQSKKLETRKQIFAGALVVSMSFVCLIWVYSLGTRFGNTEVKDQALEDVKPFKLFSNSIGSTYDNISASVGKISTTKKVEPKVEEKQIDLTPVEYTDQQ